MYDLRSDQEVIGYQDSSLNAGVTSLALSNSGRLIFAGYDDFNCHIWDSLKGEKVGELTLEKPLFYMSSPLLFLLFYHILSFSFHLMSPPPPSPPHRCAVRP